MSTPTKTGAEKHVLPRWAAGPLRAFLDQSERLSTVLHLTVRGISALRGMPRLVEALAKTDHALDGKVDVTGEGQLEEARKMAALAHAEVEHDFPLVHSQAAVSLWSSLEHTIQSLASSWIRHRPALLRGEPLSGLRIRVGDFAGVPPEQRSWYLIDLLQREVAAPLKLGVNRFETILKCLGLDGPVAEPTRTTLFELHQTRNVLVHRAGIVDRRYAKACPWLKLKPGKIVSINHTKYHEFQAASFDYITEVYIRVGQRFGQTFDLETVRTRSAVPPNPSLQRTTPAPSRRRGR